MSKEMSVPTWNESTSGKNMLGSYDLYDEYRNLIEQTVDPRTKNWALVLDPLPMITLVTAYIISCKILGPIFMRFSSPKPCKWFYVTYCIFNALFNAYTFYEMASALWYFYIIKLLELLDSVFYVLWKKGKYATILHYHHHTCMLILAWASVKWFPGGHASSVCLMNTLHHMVGYLHFGLAKMKKCLWLTKVVRSTTIVEVLVVMVHIPQAYFYDCKFPRMWMTLILVNAIPMLIYAIVLYKCIVLGKKKQC